MTSYTNWPLVESRALFREWLEFQKERDMDTDALLWPIHTTRSQVIALMDVVRANTAALKEIKIDLTKCDNPQKVAALAAKVDAAMVDLALDSQKIPPWVKDTTVGLMDIDPVGSSGSEFYGQYIVNQPLNKDNPVPWPPGYVPTVSGMSYTLAGSTMSAGNKTGEKDGHSDNRSKRSA
jgi:hypothetical protein